MITEFYSETKRGYQVYNKDCIHFNWITTKDFIEHPHTSHKLKENQENTTSNNESDF